MDGIYEAIFSSSRLLLEQLERMVCADQRPDGPCWALLDAVRTPVAGDIERLGRFLSGDTEIAEICNAIDDGSDPLIRPCKDAVVLAGQLYSDRAHCGYAMLVLPGYTRDTAEANIDLLEMLVVQLNIITSLADRNNQFYQSKLTEAGQTSKILSGTSHS